MMHDHVRLGRQKPGAVAGRDDLVEALDIHREGFLAEHRLARLERTDRPVDMHVIWERDIDRVDFGIGQQRLVILVDAQPGREVREGPGLIGGRGGDGGELRRARRGWRGPCG